MKKYTSAEMAGIDRKAIEDYGIPGHVLMEKAGRGLAALALEILPMGPLAILCGAGNNGGDGLAAARFLSEAGVSVEVLLICKPEALKPSSAVHYQHLLERGIPVRVLPLENAVEECVRVLERCSGIIDALFGIGVSRPLTSPWRELVEAMNKSGKKIVSADLPSGLNADTGEVMGVCVKASATAVFGGMKKGLTEGSGPQKAGRIRLVDIGLPPELLA